MYKQELLNQAAGREAITPRRGEAYVDWAIELLCQGETNEAVAILAGLRQPLYEPEVMNYLQCAIEDLGLDLTVLTAPEALWYGGQNVARQIVAGEIKPKVGCIEMLDIYDALSMFVNFSSPIHDIAHLVYYYDEENEEDEGLDINAIKEAKVLLNTPMPTND
jgi:hypothetical protein